jgi:hypothetical protein
MRDLDAALIGAAQAATRISGAPIAGNLRALATLGRPHGASSVADVKRLQRKAREHKPAVNLCDSHP